MVYLIHSKEKEELKVIGNIIKGVGRYADGILTIITEDTLYDFNLVTGEYGYRTIGEYWYCGGLITIEALQKNQGRL